MPGNSVSVKITAEDSASATLKKVGDTGETTGKQLEAASTKASGLGSSIGKIGQIASGVVIGQGLSKLPGFLFDAAQAAAEDEQSTARLQATLRTLPGSYDDNLAAVEKMIAKGQDLAFTDDDVRDAFDKLAQATGDSGEALNRLQVAMDLARGANIPLGDASKLLGKVTDENLQVFKRLGITLPDVASEADVLAAVQAKFAGQATAYADSTAGQFEKAQNNMGELKESLGRELMPAMIAIGNVINNQVIPALQAFAEWWDTSAKPAIAAFFAWLEPKLAAMAQYYDQHIKPFVDAAIAGFKSIVDWVTEHWDEIWAIIGPVLAQIQAGIELLVTVITAQLDLIIDLLHGDFSGAWGDVQDIIGGFATFFEATFGNLVSFLQGILSAYVAAATAIGSGIVNAIWTGLGDLYSIGYDAIRWVINGMKDAATGLIGQVTDILNPTNWDIPGFSPFFPAMEHAGNIAGEKLVQGIADAIASGADTAIVDALKQKLEQATNAATAAAAAAAGGASEQVDYGGPILTGSQQLGQPASYTDASGNPIKPGYQDPATGLYWNGQNWQQQPYYPGSEQYGIPTSFDTSYGTAMPAGGYQPMTYARSQQQYAGLGTLVINIHGNVAGPGSEQWITRVIKDAIRGGGFRGLLGAT